ncbi:M14 family metallopeptidase [Sediminibacillus halophilus]|uniref:G-D-glutamyl-meso-diaminopimelate peptidase n=1 Tax=Sediminibacillus halophilus TaxID=482461 RepID=A0A1G9R0B8_9BACI|nr:M14 family metallocarboxypeptidase [Sediminibacillus halophilus]SDM16699.1 g-D-glutamyl-meso-diaminopimelate peptidase [Sediminibacillus halophilus]
MTHLITNDSPYTFEKMEADIQELEKGYPDILQAKVIGESVEGRPLYALKVGTGRIKVLLNGSHHAREWLTSYLLMQMVEAYTMAWYKKENYSGFEVPDLLNRTSIWFIPMVNPDGVNLVQKGAEAAQHPDAVLQLNDNKTDFSGWKANIRGVDLNRQYPAGWETINPSVETPGPMNYKGPYPLSEPEAKAVYQFTKKHCFHIAAAYHSSGEEIYWKYKIDGKLLGISREIAKRISEKTSYRLVDPGPDPSGGGYTDWFLTEMRRPAFTPEISPYVGPRPVPVEHYPAIWKQNQSIGLLLAEEASKLPDNS